MRHIAGSVGIVALVDEAAVDETVTVDMSLILGEVDPDVLLKITLPAGTANGAAFPSVLLMHVLDDELPGPQQKDVSSWNG